ncbi:MAG: 4-hydroxy-tetrahydrodipicolinate reductase [Bacillota bacterium]|nr:4-hydroxy-tetrahydrodipicolinate reductase [Bacillota bacterium]
MVNVLLVGCGGRMGKTIVEASKNIDEVTIAAGIDKFSNGNFEFPVFSSIEECNIKCDVILDFSRPDTLDSIIAYSEKFNLPIVFCTTGYTPEQLDKLHGYSKKQAIFRSGNMSLGVNIVNNILKMFSAALYENFDIEVIEKHHNQKVDAPSGTALLLADTIKNSIQDETKYVHGRDGIAKRERNEIGIHAVRGGSIVGEHEIIFAGQGETIEIKHTAISREVFAVGALKASAYMVGKQPGLYNMDHVLNVK